MHPPVRITQTGQTMEVMVFGKRADHITAALGARGSAFCIVAKYGQ